MHQRGMVFFSHWRQHPAQHALALPGDSAMKLQLSTVCVEVFSSDVRRPDDCRVALPEQTFQLACSVGRPGDIRYLFPCSAQKCVDGRVTGESVMVGSQHGVWTERYAWAYTRGQM
ncbi:hypothetical protein ALP66_103012 [Pseudomonas amygdali pv. photiniae]|uniref:Uncharacterized protein n=1 Tax=Pseudomonas amygdali pv. photiniae TaxID=251724 RepID=A0A658KDZ8_PSEA0|nr:hypothetical protein ALP66_103012 [Pseudomonas amygdali pv. photiniae]